ncbi:MAG TPA: SUF system NifU family Fe-S cluster assembly protein [Candidatus Binatia bacterium]|nr:SUF system NifU family Fe-S cluster assembly protein [Candidatus Binatia bacterium]
MSDLRELYQEVILDHNKRPRNFQKLEGANRTAEGYNPLCGDQITVYLRLEDDVIKDISFQGSGCAISKASASLMTTSVKGKTQAEAEVLFDGVHTMLTGERDTTVDPHELGKLAVLSGVCEFPARVKCASLAWHTLHAALKGEGTAVSTE